VLTKRGTTRFRDEETWRHASHPVPRLRPLLGRDWATAYLFVLPSLCIMGGLIAYPFGRAVYLSLTKTLGSRVSAFVGLANYRTLWSDRFFREAVGITLCYTLWSVGPTLVLSLLAALLLHRLGARAGLLTGLLLLPWIVPDTVRAIAWKGLLDPLYGGVNRLLIDLGAISRGYPFFGSPKTALPSVVVVNIWQRMPFFTIGLLAGLKAIEVELYEAAEIDGAGGWRQFLHVTLPGLGYAIAVVALLGTIWSFNEFNLIFLITGGGPMNATKVYSVLAYQYLRQRAGMGMAVALSMAPALVVLMVLLSRYVLRDGGDEHGGKPHTGKPVLPVRDSAIGLATWLGRRVARVLWMIHDGLESLLSAMWQPVHRLIGSKPAAARAAKRAGNLLVYGLVAVLLFYALAPFYWILVTAFKTELQITRFESVLWPRPWSLEQFRRLFGPGRSLVHWLENTLLVSLFSSLLSTVAAAMGAYPLARLHWRGARAYANAVLISYLMPTVMMVMPIYQLFTGLGLMNTLLALMLSYPPLMVPFALWLMAGYYRTIPQELEDAALIDGCGRLQAFTRVILPLSSPALMAAALFGFSVAWSEFVFAYSLILSENKMTVTLGLTQMIFGDVQPWGELAAAALLMAAPVLAVYGVGQRFMVSGLTLGALRG
jgi:multiple sugar transport system permease protein